jgi:hypothetical protein
MKTSKRLWIFTLLLITSLLYAADHLRPGDMRSIGMGGHGVTASPLFNPALIVLAEQRSIGIHYFNRYAVQELGTASGSYFLPNPILPAGIHMASFGYDAYRQSMFRLLTGKRLSETCILGLSLQYSLLQTALFEEVPARLAADLGIGYSPVENLFAGLLIMNLPSVSVGDNVLARKDFTPYLIQAGLQWEYINSLLMSATLETGDERTLAGSIGIEYQPSDDFSIRAGLKGLPLLPSFGFGYRYAHFFIDAAAVYHPVLGISTGIGFSYTF